MAYELVLVGRMQPAAADVKDDVVLELPRECAPAEPVARLQHEHAEAFALQRSRGTNAGRTGADDGDVDLGGEGHAGPCNAVMPGLVPGIHVFLLSKTWMAGTSPAMTA